MPESSLSQTLAYSNWQKVGIRHHHGINTPLFSLKTHRSSGIGEYLDLLPLIDFCQRIGFDLIQILPINDSGDDPSPYNALSSKALHPIYLSLHDLPYLKADSAHELRELNRFKRVHYAKVLEKKMAFLQDYYQREGHKICTSTDFQNFVENNPWLHSYALFKSLKQKMHGTNWQEWPKNAADHVTFSELQFPIFLQYLCFQQMQKVKDYAEKKHILIKGDIPILISPDSADVWNEPDLFNLNYAAGAPPDRFNPSGQHWGFPLYNWNKVAEDRYRWWKDRLKISEHFYHLYRIDHIIGLFRIWAFPNGDLKRGCYIPTDERTWIAQGEAILQIMLKATSMLPIGEDLGITLSPQLKGSLSNLGISGTKVIRWERNREGNWEFIPVKDYPAASMTTVSTHDSDSVKLWWQNAPREAKDYAASQGWKYEPVLSNEFLYAILKESHHSGSLFHINLLQEYLDLFPEFTFSNLSNERINIPGIVSDRNWSFRYKPFLEDIVDNEKLIQTMQELIR